MAMFDNGVSAPGGGSYSAPLLSFASFGDWGKNFIQGSLGKQQSEQNTQQQQLNQQRIAEGQRQAEIAQTFKGGLPRDAQGNIDYRQAVAMLAQKGDTGALWNGADAMAIQSAGKLSPMLSGGAQPPQGQPTSLPAKPMPAPSANSPQGDPGTGTIASLVTDRLPNQDTTTGQTIAKIAQVIGVDPNATLTPGQVRRAQGLLQKYAPATAEAAAGGGNAGSLPPSANAVSPAPKAAPPAQQPAPIGAGAPPQQQPAPMPPQAQPQPQAAAPVPQGAPPAAAPQQQPQPQPQQQPHPITPQVPLPKDFSDPQAAILALRTEAARLSSNPRARGQVDELKNWAERIEESIKPVAVTPNTTLLDPRTGQPVYSGGQPTMAPDAIQGAAENYLQTGKLPPNMGRGTQGNADRNAIMNAVSELAHARGIDQADLPKKWQEFKAQQVGIQRFTSGKQGDTTRSFNVLVDHLDTLTEAAGALKNGDIRIFNQWKQKWAASSGNPAPTNFDGVKALVGDEIVKAVVGSAGALADREEVKKDLDRASSPKQLFELIDRYKKLALGQLRGLRKQYEASTGLKNFGDLLLPETLAALGGNEGKGTAPDKEGWVTLPNGARIQEIKPEPK